MDRFFTAKDSIQGNIANITGEDAAHISRVLRLRAGDSICLCDGQGAEYDARITEVNKLAVRVELVECRLCVAEPTCSVTLYQALPKTGKLETIIQKCVELGVKEIAPVSTQRCVARPEEFEGKRVRYQRVAYEAAKQSKRGIVPRILPLKPLATCDFADHALILLAYEEERGVTLKQALNGCSANSIAIIIGPEGGFAPEEVSSLIGKGAVPVGLGPRILRTETAGPAMLAMVLYELEL